MSKPIIQVQDLSFQYSQSDERFAIDGLSTSIYEGEWLAIIGHNGSGKSTFSKLLVGLLEAKSGTIEVDGKVLSMETVWDIRSQIGLVFQNPDNQFVGATVEDDVAFALENRGIPVEEMHERVASALKRVKMWDYRDKEPASLSGGQKQRVAIAGVIAMAPKIMILDESTSMLDPEGREELMAVVADIKQDNDLTVISITHDLNEAAEADRILVFKEGNIIKEGRPADIFTYGHKLTEVGLDVPFAEQLKRALAKRGVDVPSDYIDEEGLGEWLCKSHLNM
ncbi:energy-coupling factor ABC transporter ATP-binding protein [Aerococcus urinaeequi]|uniref:Energy-coupling factor ABC transporter ATP-binding protein n=1 Tax=Aerococcus viridans TaxID=1377 RepID=A0A2N6UGA8_9LACT|nr:MULTISPECIES: energy-coupling factor ABC transporter ATP-binding protein [Aerococcus]OFU53363.1 energy-coupling factor transporter ATPase [Aerococcus sp. HMSC10H05]PMC80641.1 energy-coupling factor ABC transporter ATP-binding protein [Aerococcus viridans]